MQKVVDFLEKYVQWLALGLGVLFVLYMVYAYVLTPPATVRVGTATHTASNVDQAIIDGPAQRLEAAVGDQRGISIPVQPFDEDFIATIGNVGEQVAATPNWFPPVAVAGTIKDDDDIKQKDDEGRPPKAGAIALAKPPKAKVWGVEATVVGRSMVQLPVAAPGDANAVAAGPEGFNPNANPGGVQPVANVADRDWATAFFKVSMADLAAAWRQAGLVPPNVPAIAQQTLFLEVVAEREEQTGVDAQGKPVWGNRTTLKPLPTVNLLPLPPATLPPVAQIAFQQWAEQNQADILQPPFYPVTGGDPWHEPGVQVAPILNPNAPGGMFDEGMPPPAALDPNRKPTPQEIREQREADRKRRQEEAKAKRDAARQQNTQPRPPGGGGGAQPPRGSYQAADPNRPGRPGRPPVYGGQPAYPGAGGMPGYPTGYPTGYPAGQPGGQFEAANPNAARNAPQGQFVPNAQAADIPIWVHDDAVQPGKTYRYRVRYALKNPVYDTNLAPRAITGVFALQQGEADFSDWTNGVSIATRTQFFIVGLPPNRVSVQVFRWQDGRLNAKNFTVTPGDTIGGVDGDIDYGTGHTVVDIRDTGAVLVMDDKNVLRERGFESDARDPEFLKLKQQLPQQPAAAAGGFGPNAAAAR